MNYYKKISGKHFIIEKNGNRKLYKLGTNILLYEGIYKNGKKNGKGKEYNDFGDLIFEGEYLNGKKWNGNETKYNDDRKLLFEAEYSKGKIVKIKKNFGSYCTLVFINEGIGKEYYQENENYFNTN